RAAARAGRLDGTYGLAMAVPARGTAGGRSRRRRALLSDGQARGRALADVGAEDLARVDARGRAAHGHRAPWRRPAASARPPDGVEARTRDLRVSMRQLRPHALDSA